MQKKTLKLRYKVDPSEINFIDMIIKAYEGIGTVRVDHNKKNEIWIVVSPGTKKEVKAVMADLSNKFLIEFIGEEKQKKIIS